MLELGQIIHTAGILRRNVVDLREILLRDLREVDMAQHLGRVGVQVLARLVVHDALVELARLVVLAQLALVVVVALARDDVVRDLVRRFGGVWAEFGGEAVGRVLLVACVVGVDPHRSIEVDRAVGLRGEGAVDGDLVQVDADAVVLRVAVEEHAELEEWVRRVFNTGDHGAGGKGGLLDVAVVVFWVLVQDEFAEVVHGELAAGPDLGHVEGVEAEFLRVCVFGLHDLDFGGPLELLAFFDAVPELALAVVWVLARDLDGFWLAELLLPSVGDEVVLDVDEFACRCVSICECTGEMSVLPLLTFLVDPLECVAAVAVLIDPSIGCTMV